MNRTPGIIWLWLLAIGVAILLSALNLVFGELNQDEGWYLYAAREVIQGRHPYLDFASTQGPVMTYAYAGAVPLVSKWGLAGGRFFTAVLGLASACFAGLLAARMFSSGEAERGGLSSVAGLVAFSLAGVNVYQSYFTTIVKTYALCAVLITAGFFCLSLAFRRRWVLPLIGAGILLSLAAGARTSAVVALPVVFLWLASDKDVRRGWVRAAVFAFSAGVTLCAVFLPFAIKAPVPLWFALIEYHSGREAGGLLEMLAYKAGFLSRMLRAYFVSAGLLFVCLIFRLFNRGRPEAGGETGERNVAPAVWFTVMAVTAVHFFTPFPYEDYQVMVYPLFTAALAALFVSSFRSHLSSLRHSLAVLILCLASSFSSPINESWFVGERDRIWWPIKTESSLAKLRRAAGIVRANAGESNILLTQDTYLAVEAGMDVPDGMELGPFCHFPGLSRKEAEARHVLNTAMFEEILLGGEAEVAAVSGYGFAIAAPFVMPLPEKGRIRLLRELEKKYKLKSLVESFGQAGTDLRIYVSKGD